MEATIINPCILSLNLQQCLDYIPHSKLQASLYWSWLTGGHQLSGPIGPLSYSVDWRPPDEWPDRSSLLLCWLAATSWVARSLLSPTLLTGGHQLSGPIAPLSYSVDWRPPVEWPDRSSLLLCWLAATSWVARSVLSPTLLTGGHQLSGPIGPLSYSVTAFRPRFIHQWSSVLFLLLYRKMKSSLSAVRVSPLLHVSATIFTKFLFLLLSLSRRCSSLSMTQPTCSLTFSIQNPSSRAFLSVGVMAAAGVFCVLLSAGSPCVGIPDLGSTVGKTGAGVLTQLAAFTPFWYSPLCVFLSLSLNVARANTPVAASCESRHVCTGLWGFVKQFETKINKVTCLLIFQCVRLTFFLLTKTFAVLFCSWLGGFRL